MRRRPAGLAASLRRAWLLGALAAVACASARPFDRLVDAGRYQDAVRAFETDSTLWRRPEALLTAARLYADPALPTRDAARARAALGRLAADFPDSEEAEQGRPLLALLTELERVRAELDARTVELKGKAALADTLAAAREGVERDLQAARERIERLEAALEEARRELERLKAVDLRPRPRTPR